MSEPDRKMSIFKNNEKELITQSESQNKIILRGTFGGGGGTAVHLVCSLDKHDPEKNRTLIFLHLPEQMQEISAIQTVLPDSGFNVSNIHQGLPDDSLHEHALGESTNRAGDLVFGEFRFVVGDTEIKSDPVAFRSPTEFFRFFLMDQKGKELSCALRLDDSALLAANRFYKTVALDSNFPDHPDELRQELLNRNSKGFGLGS